MTEYTLRELKDMIARCNAIIHLLEWQEHNHVTHSDRNALNKVIKTDITAILGDLKGIEDIKYRVIKTKLAFEASMEPATPPSDVDDIPF